MGETCYMGVFSLGSMNTLEMKKVLKTSMNILFSSIIQCRHNGHLRKLYVEVFIQYKTKFSLIDHFFHLIMYTLFHVRCYLVGRKKVVYRGFSVFQIEFTWHRPWFLCWGSSSRQQDPDGVATTKTEIY